MRFKSQLRMLAVALTMAVLLTGCGIKIGFVRNATARKMNASFGLMSATMKKSMKLDEGSIIIFEYDLKQEKGALNATFENSSRAIMVDFEPNTSGEKRITIEQGGTYHLIVRGKGAKGSYKFEWALE